MHMRRVLKWLWRQFRRVALVGLLLLGGGMLGVVHPAPALAMQAARTMLIPTVFHAAATSPEQERAHERARRGRLIYLGSLLYQALLLVAFFAMGGSRWLAGLVARFHGWVPALLVVMGVLGLASAVLTFPLEYYSGFVFQHQYGMSNQTTGQWLRDFLVSEGVSLLFGIQLAILGYAVLRRAPHTWWLWVTAASIPLYILLMLITPVFITPLFNKFTPLREEPLRSNILAMARAHGIHADNVYEVDASRQSNAVNAYVIGFGPTMRIVLYDTLVKDFTADEAQFIMTHEMGHYVLGHIYQGILFAILGTLIASFAVYHLSAVLLQRYGAWLGFDTLGNPASLPLLAAIGFVLSLLAMPIGNAFSRNLEWQADRFAAQNYPHPDAGIAAFEKLGQINISEENPPQWAVILFGSHPTLAQRIEALRELKAGNPNPWPLPREVKK